MTRVNSEGRRNLEPQKKELTKAGAERRTAHDAMLPVGAAGQTLFSLNRLPICLISFATYVINLLLNKKEV